MRSVHIQVGDFAMHKMARTHAVFSAHLRCHVDVGNIFWAAIALLALLLEKGCI